MYNEIIELIKKESDNDTIKLDRLDLNLLLSYDLKELGIYADMLLDINNTSMEIYDHIIEVSDNSVEIYTNELINRWAWTLFINGYTKESIASNVGKDLPDVLMYAHSLYIYDLINENIDIFIVSYAIEHITEVIGVREMPMDMLIELITDLTDGEVIKADDIIEKTNSIIEMIWED